MPNYARRSAPPAGTAQATRQPATAASRQHQADNPAALLAATSPQAATQARFAGLAQGSGRAAQLRALQASADARPLPAGIAAVQRAGGEEEEEMLQGRFADTAQRNGVEEEEPLQGRFVAAPAQRLAADEDEPAQMAKDTAAPNRSGHGTAKERLTRMKSRAEARKKREPLQKGLYETPTGQITISGLWKQLITQSKKQNYGGVTLGSVPCYTSIRKALPKDALVHLHDRNQLVSPSLTLENRLGASLAYGIVHISEEDRAPGTSAYIRAIVRDYIKNGGDHPLSEKMLPASASAQQQRELMEGRTHLNDQQLRALENDDAMSSDEEEDHFVKRPVKKQRT